MNWKFRWLKEKEYN